MKKVLNWMAPIVVGFLIGGLLTMAAPVNAKGAGAKALARRVVALEAQMVQIQADAAASNAAIEARLEELEKVTQLLDHDGSYVGYVDSVQVWSHYCTEGAEAIWVDYEGYPELSCSGTAASVQRPFERPRGQAIERLSKGGNRN